VRFCGLGFMIWVKFMICERCNQCRRTVHSSQICDETTQINPSLSDCLVTCRLWRTRYIRIDLLAEKYSTQLLDNRRCPIEATNLSANPGLIAKNSAEKDEIIRYQHVTGKELLDAFRQLALKKFGKTGQSRHLGSWKIHRGRKISGRLFFKMIAMPAY